MQCYSILIIALRSQLDTNKTNQTSVWNKIWTKRKKYYIETKNTNKQNKHISRNQIQFSIVAEINEKDKRMKGNQIGSCQILVYS